MIKHNDGLEMSTVIIELAKINAQLLRDFARQMERGMMEEIEVGEGRDWLNFNKAWALLSDDRSPMRDRMLEAVSTHYLKTGEMP